MIIRIGGLILILLMLGCRLDPQRPPLRPLTLPDLSGSSASVRGQLESAHAALVEKLQSRPGSDADLANAFGTLGQLTLAAQFLDAAETCFANAETLQSADARWPYYLGHVWWNRGEASRAATAFERALTLNPADVPTLIWIGEARLAQGRPADAEGPLLDALTRDPQSGAAAFALGRLALAKRDYAEAVKRLEEALMLSPFALVVHYPLAVAYRGLGDLTRADVHLRQRGNVQVDMPDPLMETVDELLESAGAYEVRGKRALSSGDWMSAVAAFRRGVELAPSNPSIRHQLATAMALSGDTTGAIEQFQEVVRRSPTFMWSRFSLGVLLETIGRRQEGIAQLSAAVAIDPDYAEGHRRLAELLMQSGQMSQALAHFRESIRSNPRVPEVRLEYADALAHSGRRDEARRELAAGAALHPDHAEFADRLSAIAGRP